MSDPAVLTGVGVVSAFGVGARAFFRGLAEGRSAVGPIRFDVGYKLKRQVIGFDVVTGQPIFERPFAYFITLGYAF